MQRLATTVAIAAWTGFLGVFSLELLTDAAAPDLLVSASAVSWPPAVAAQFDDMAGRLSVLSAPAEVVLALACFAIVGTFILALVALHGPGRAKPAKAERLAAIALGGVSVLAIGTELFSLPLLPVDPGSGLVWVAVALSVLAVLFDRLVAVETAEEVEEDERFHAQIAALAQGMARQTQLYPDTENFHGERRR